jgi:hypothetical protein
VYTFKEPFENYNMWNEFYDAVVTRGERPDVPEVKRKNIKSGLTV